MISITTGEAQVDLDDQALAVVWNLDLRGSLCLGAVAVISYVYRYQH